MAVILKEGTISSLKSFVNARLRAGFLDAGLRAGLSLGAAALALQNVAQANPVSEGTTETTSALAKTPAELSAETASRAIIVIGLTADDAQAGRLRVQAETARRGFLARGLPVGSIQIVAADFGTRITREKILYSMKVRTPPSDETWVLLLGQAAPSREGQVAFQVSGPRLSAEEFATALGSLPGKKFVVVATAMSGGFLPPLQKNHDVEAVSATADTGEIYEPRFGQAWTEALVAHPQAGFSALAADAATRVETYYREKSLAQGEHARLLGPESRTIVEVQVPKQ